MGRWSLVAVALSMLLLGTAVGGVAARTILISRNSTAEFRGGVAPWFCLNGGATVSCQSGDALPRVTLGVDRRVIGLRVNSSSRPCARRVLRPSPDPSDPMMEPYWEYLYTFKAFGCP